MIGRPAPFSVRTEASSFTATTSRSASRGGALQVAHVPDVQDVEAAVRERHGATGGAIGGNPSRQVGQGQDWHL